ncbi:hypothetical protein BGX27_004795 [Mortierella sp. AM989]|nr:hypothetical protein BGX27_004795 [Mortierella sp. AM989]
MSGNTPSQRLSNNSNGRSNTNSPQLADALGFASRFFQQIGNAPLDDDESRSESEDSDSGQSNDNDSDSQDHHNTAPPGMFIHSSVNIHQNAESGKNKLSDDEQADQDSRQSKRTKLEAIANLISGGLPAFSSSQGNLQSKSSLRGDSQRTVTPIEPAQFNTNKPDCSVVNSVDNPPQSRSLQHQQPQQHQHQHQHQNQYHHQRQQQDIVKIQQQLQLQQQQQLQQQHQRLQRQPQQQALQKQRVIPFAPDLYQPSSTQIQPLQQNPRLQQDESASKRQPLPRTIESHHEGDSDRPRSANPSISSISSTPSPSPKGSAGGFIDLTEEEPTTISDDDVMIDESKTTAVANRNMCFGMIQSLVVTLYPRHLEYVEGKADRVIIKRATTANKASLAVEHEAGLYGYIVSELAETLVPLVDAKMIWWDAYVPRQRKLNNVSAPINIIIYGRPDYQMAVAKALYGKVRLEEPASFDHRTRYCNPLVPAPGETLSPYDKWRGVSNPGLFSGGSGSHPHGYSGYSGYAGYSGSSVRSAEEIKNQIDGVFKGLRSATDLPEVEPASTMATTMYRHQKQALYFLSEREKQEDYSDNEKNKLTSLWRVRQQLHRHPTYLNVVTSQETSIKPTSMRGGILADDMGLGKTITIISLIMATLDRGMYSQSRANAGTSLTSASTAAPDFLNSGDQVTEYDSPPSPTIRPLLPTTPKKPMFKKRITNLRTKSHATLIICPLSTVQNWEEQCEAHVKKDALKVYVYHGGQRVSDPGYLAKHDVVITTYNLLGTEYSKECKGRESENGPSKAPSVLQHIDWFRVVLDEAHIIKEVSTIQSKAACALTAERRWCLTGTPVQNKLDDLFALVKFLRMQPFDEKAHWAHYIAKPIKAANPIGITRLQTLMKVITLRRTKTQMVDGKPLLELPTRTDHMRVLELSLNERQMYQRMELSAKQTVDQIVQENKIMKNYAHILQAILKLRQICAHYALVKNIGDDLDTSGEFNLLKASAILTLLQESGNDQCNYCFHSSTPTPIVTRCEHIYCPECVKRLNPVSFMLIQKGNANVSVSPELKTDFACPQCTALLRPVDLIQIQDDTEDKVAATAVGGGHAHTRTDENGMFIHSTKVKALMDDLVQAREISKKTGDPLVKSVVFSQWTSMLDLIEDGLSENQIKFTRLDGTMQRNDRTTAMVRFKERPDISVILISLKAGGVGLNLTSAQRVYLMDPHWNPSVESQAVDRIHRLGQTKPVDIVRFIIKESIEENILELQKRKTELSEMTFAEKLSKQEVLKRRLEDLQYLFQGSSELMKKPKGTNSPSSTPTSTVTTTATATVKADCLNMLASGSLYVYALYATSFTGHLGYSQTQTSTIAVIGDIGLYGIGPVSGLLADRLGPRTTSFIAACLLATGYGLLSAGYSNGLDSVMRGQPPTHFLRMASYLFLAGMGSSASYMAAFTSLARNFRHARGIALGIPVSFFGLSAAVLTLVAQSFFTVEVRGLLNALQDKLELDTAQFLLFLGLFGGISNALSTVGMNIVPAPRMPASGDAVENPRVAPTFQQQEPSAVNDLNEQTPLLRDDTSTRLNRQSQDQDSADFAGSNKQHHHSDVPSVSGKDFFMDRDAQYYLLVMFCLSGTGLMIINSISAIIDAVAASEKVDTGSKLGEKSPVSAIHAAHVGLISLSSYAGRILASFGSDIAIHRYGALRIYVLPIATTCMALAQVVGMFASLKWLYLCSALTGLAYGGYFGVAGTIVAELWGAETCGQNWGFISWGAALGGMVFNLLFGIVMDAERPIVDGEPQTFTHLQSANCTMYNQNRDDSSHASKSSVNLQPLPRAHAPLACNDPSNAMPFDNSILTIAHRRNVNVVKALIVGAGVAGLALAVMMDLADIEYEILELSTGPESEKGGYLPLGPPVLRLLEQMGLLEQIEKASKTIHGLTIIDTEGRKMGRLEGVEKERYGYPYIATTRSEIYKILLDRVPKANLHFGKHVIETHQNPNGVSCKCSDGSTYYGDIIVGADGADSLTRERMFKQLHELGKLPESDLEATVYSHTFITGVSKPLDKNQFPAIANESLGHQVIYSKGTSHSFWYNLVSGNRIAWNLYGRLPTPKQRRNSPLSSVRPNLPRSSSQSSSSTSSQRVHDDWMAPAKDFEEQFQDLLAARCPFGTGTVKNFLSHTSSDKISRVDTDERLFKTWYHGRIVLIGDASHHQLNVGGQGTIQSLLDAVCLVNLLYDMEYNSPHEITNAFKKYHAKRSVIVKTSSEETIALDKVFHSQGIMVGMMRKFLFNASWTIKMVNDRFNNNRPQISFLPFVEDRED